MKEIVDLLKGLWRITIVREAVLIVITASITFYFNTHAQRREQRIRFQNGIADKIDSGLEKAREAATEANIYEAYEGSISLMNPQNANAFSGLTYYPAFMTDKDSFKQFAIRLSELRIESERYLDLISVGYLYIMEKYLMSLAMYINKNGLQDGFSALGLLLIVDIEKWSRNFDKHLTRRLNHPHYKVYTKAGKYWQLIKWYMKRKYINNSVLNDLMTGSAKYSLAVENSAVRQEDR